MFQAKKNILPLTIMQAWAITILILAIFPTIRLLIIGNQPSRTIFEYFFSALPELIMLFFFLFIVISKKNEIHHLRWQQTDTMVVIYLAASMLLGLIHPNSFSLVIYELKIAYLPAIFYFIFRLLSLLEIKRMLLFLTYLLMTIALSGEVFYLFFPSQFSSFRDFLELPYQEYIIPRFSFLIWSPVVMGSSMVMGFLLSLFLLQRLVRWIGIIIFSVGIICTVSRGAILGLLLTLLVVFIFYNKYRLLSLYSLGIFLAVFLIFSFLFTNSFKLFLWSFSSSISLATNSSDEKRSTYYKDILAFSSSETYSQKNSLYNLLFGHGLGKGGHVAYRFLKDQSRYQYFLKTTDGHYLKVFIETGVAGLIIFFVSWGLLLIWILKQSLINPNVLFTFSTSILFFVLVQNLVSNTMDFYFIAPLFWSSIGIIRTNRYEPNTT